MIIANKIKPSFFSCLSITIQISTLALFKSLSRFAHYETQLKNCVKFK